MSLSIGIVGLPNVGKSTLFKALTKQQIDIANYPFCTIDPNVGIVQLPDERLDKLVVFSKSKKVVPAVVEFVDIAGLVKGAAEGEGLGNQFLANIREVDVIVEVVRTFKNEKITHVHNTIDPENDIEIIGTELILADLETVNKRVVKLAKEARTQNKEAIQTLAVVEKIKKTLEAGLPARTAFEQGGDDDELALVKDLHLLTFKPILYVFNGSEQNSSENSINLDIKLEEDMIEMSEEEKKEFEVSSNLDKLVLEAYKMLGLMTFLTTGEDETRAWTIKKDSSAPEAGAAIHSDFQEKFIRADVINWQTLLDVGSYPNARDKGLVRTVGKDYVVQDGDVVEFKI